MKRNDVVASTPQQRIPSFTCDPKVGAKSSSRSSSSSSSSSSCTNNFVPPNVQKRLKHLVAPHVDSFNYFLETGNELALEDILPVDVQLEDASNNNNEEEEEGGGGNDNDKSGKAALGPFLQIKVHKLQIGYPSKTDDLTNGVLTPRECRERGLSYSASISIGLTIEIDDGRTFQVQA